MKLFKTVDEKFKEIGFRKVENGFIVVAYERYNEMFNYTQRIELCHKSTGMHIVHSYDVNLSDEKGIGNTSVGLTMYEMKLCIKKMKQMGWKIKKK